MAADSAPSPALSHRAQALERLSSETLDLLVIGGGITGAGAAREAARRGLRVGLVEQEDLAYGTSSRSSKLVHGGLRYLEQFAFQLVFEAVSERRVLQEIAPHLVRPVPFLFPVYRSSRRGPFMVDLGLWLYDALSLFRSAKIHRSLRVAGVEEEEPLLLRDDLLGASIYYDCTTDDARLTLETALDAQEAGAVVATYARVEELVRVEGRLVGARVRDRLADRLVDVRFRCAINATGPWTDGMREGKPDLLRPTKGVHIVVERNRLPVRMAAVMLHPTDGRVMFVIPWGDRAYVGTTDTDYQGEPGEEHATADDVRYCLDAANHFYPEVRLGLDDVLSTWAGLRPLICEEGNPSSVSREHQVVVDPDGLVTIAGGKLTTYRRMAVEVVEDAMGIIRMSGFTGALRASATDQHPLPGARGWPEDDNPAPLAEAVRAAAQPVKIPPETALHLAETYGGAAIELGRRIARNPALAAPLTAGRPDVMAQVDWAVDQELAERVSDVLIRRTQLFFKDREQGLGAAEAVAARMAEKLGWDETRTLQEVEAYRADVARSRRWRDEAGT